MQIRLKHRFVAKSNQKDVRRPEDWFPPPRSIGTPSTVDVELAIDDAINAFELDREINTTAPISGGGDLSADRTFALLGTKAQFDASCSDGNFLYVGDVSGYTDEQAQDAVGGTLTDTATIDLTYNDGAGTITADVKAGSIGATELAATTVVAGSYTATDLTVDADGRITAAANGSTSSYTDEQAQDAVGNILTDSTTINFTYNDGAGTITAVVQGLVQADISGLTTTDSPQFAGINIGHATDTTLTRVSAGVVAIEGNTIITAATKGWKWLETLTISAAASANTEAWAGLGYRAVRLTFRLTVSSDASTLSARFKHNGSYKATSYRGSANSASSSGANNFGSTPTTGITIGNTGGTWGLGSDTLEHISGTIIIFDPDNTTKPKQITFLTEHGAPSGAHVTTAGGGTYDSTDYNTALAGFQFIMSAGTMTGWVEVEVLV